MQTDRNFDNLIDKFEQRVYGTLKGDLRIKLLKEDLQSLHQSPTLSIWDAGCGLAQISSWFAEAGHALTLCDLSAKMLARAQQRFSEQNLSATFLQGAAQDLAVDLPQFDLVVFHAVLEWLAAPKATLKTIADKVAPNGHLSLLYYNRNSIIMTNALKGDWRLQFLLNDHYMGKGKNLTPPNPQFPDDVINWLQQWGFDVKIETGIRVFHDYLTPEVLQNTNLDELIELENRYCRAPTFRQMARYIHLVAQRQKPH